MPAINPVPVRQDDFVEQLIDFPEWPGLSLPKRTNWISCGLDEGEITPFRGKQCTLSIVARASGDTTVLLADGFRFDKITVQATVFGRENACSRFDEELLVANEIFQQIGVVFEERIDCDLNSDPRFSNVDRNANEHRQLYVIYGVDVQKHVDVFFVDGFEGSGYRAFTEYPSGFPKVVLSPSGAAEAIGLAHELGHALFLEDRAQGQDHVIGDSWRCRFFGEESPCARGGDRDYLMHFDATKESKKLTTTSAARAFRSPLLNP